MATAKGGRGASWASASATVAPSLSSVACWLMVMFMAAGGKRKAGTGGCSVLGRAGPGDPAGMSGLLGGKGPGVPFRRQIGRAAGRGKGEISGVAGSLKKKKIELRGLASYAEREVEGIVSEAKVDARDDRRRGAGRLYVLRLGGAGCGRSNSSATSSSSY